MLARLLRFIYLFQLICGALLGSYLAVQSASHGSGALALLYVPTAMLGLPVLLQVLTILILMLRSRPGTDWGPWWRAFGGELRAALLVFGLRQSWPRLPTGVLQPSPTDGGSAKLPVLLVHGYLCNHRAWDDVARALSKAGHPVLAIDLEPLFTSIDDYAGVIERGVSQLLAQTGDTQLALVGHSMGGLAIRAWLRATSATRQAQVARIVTLGTPHQGTQITRASATPNGAQMIWHSPWLMELARGESSAQRGLMQIAITHHDNVVYPQRAQVLDGAQVTEFEGVGHLELCLNAGVIEWICRQVDKRSTPP